jgi:hypothetical protein
MAGQHVRAPPRLERVLVRQQRRARLHVLRGRALPAVERRRNQPKAHRSSGSAAAGAQRPLLRRVRVRLLANAED